jgi:shikimate dehydrogenase
MRIDNETKVTGSISGKPSKLGAAMFNAAYQHLSLNILHIPFTVVDIKNAIAGIRALNIVGSAVSMPHKEEVMKYLDKIDPTAKKIGAVNTIANTNGVLTGYNSDWIGAIEALKEVTDLKNKNVVLIGAGGAARAIAYGLKESDSKVILFNKTQEKGKRLADEFDLEFGGSLDKIGKIDDYDILVNATSAGFHNGNESVVEEEALKENKIVMDVVFVPTETKLLKLAKKKGCRVVPGYRMLIHQALFQFELYTDKKAPFEVMEKALLEVLGK